MENYNELVLEMGRVKWEIGRGIDFNPLQKTEENRTEYAV